MRHEDPDKELVRNQCLLEVERAGFTAVDIIAPIPLKAESTLFGGNLPDVQARGTGGILHHYFVRPQVSGEGGVPASIASLIPVIDDRSNHMIELVTRASGARLEEHCESLGIGLLVFSDSDGFRYLVASAGQTKENEAAVRGEKIKHLGTLISTRVAMEIGALNVGYGNVAVATADWKNRGQGHVDKMTNDIQAWKDQEARLLVRLAELERSGSSDEITRFEAEVFGIWGIA